jgi:hypothetical protein
MYMYQDDSLSSVERRRIRSFLSESKRMERLQRNLMLKEIIDQHK